MSCHWFQKIWPIRLGEMSNGRTAKLTNGTENIGPSGKILGTNKSYCFTMNWITKPKYLKSQDDILFPLWSTPEAKQNKKITSTSTT